MAGQYHLPRLKWWQWALVVVVAVWLFGRILNHPSTSSVPPAEAREALIKSQFSQWDGSHPKVVDAIKKTMHDPNSFKHVETTYWDMKTHLVVKTTFRGTNALNAVVTNWAKVKVDLQGNVIEIMEQGQGQ